MKSKRLIRIVSLTLIGATVMAAAPTIANAAWKKNSTGWWYTEGSSWATGWRSINGVWYYFDGNGYMKTGWINDRGTWYYLESSGAMKKGWVNDRGTWYYLNGSGAMQTGWIKDKGTWYYLKSSGAMAKNEFIEYKGDKYYLEASGAMSIGWKIINNDNYYFNGSGAAAKGEYKIGNDSYYFDIDSCKLLINGIVGNITTDKDGRILDKSEDMELELINDFCGGIRCFDKKGNPPKGWVKIKGNKYYVGENGYVASGVQAINGKLYPFDQNGKIINEEGLKDFGNSLFYVNKDGSVYLGWKTINNKKYYFSKDGYAARGIEKIEENQAEYYFDCVTSELVCNANKFGITTDDNGKLKKDIDVEYLKSYILDNDSEEISKLRNDKNKFEIKYNGLNTLKSVYRPKHGMVGTIYDENHKVRYNMVNEQVLTFSAKYKDKNGKEQERLYYISVEDGKIYTQGRLEYDSVSEKFNLFEIKDNKIVSYYDVNMYQV